MYEVELKVRAPHDAVRDRLAERDATPVGTVEQVDTYYDHPVRAFGETDEALRVRREVPVDDGGNAVSGDPASELTYKGPLVEAESKTRRELETAVADGETTREMLGELGFEPAATVEKRREHFELDGYTVTLDEVAGLGEFVEVETEAEGDAVESARSGAVARLEELDLDPGEQIRSSYLGLLLEGEDEEEP